MKQHQITLEKAFFSDYCEWEPTITATISPSLAAKMDAMQALVIETNYVRSVDVTVPDDFLDDETERLLQDQCRYDVSHISVGAWGFVFYLQGKWDAHIQTEHTPA